MVQFENTIGNEYCILVFNVYTQRVAMTFLAESEKRIARFKDVGQSMDVEPFSYIPAELLRRVWPMMLIGVFF